MLTPNNNSARVASTLSRKATLVAVNISGWSARRLDRKVTREVNESHGAREDAGRYNKLLVEAVHMKEITAAVSAIRELHYRLTQPWGDDGQRILPNTLYAQFTTEFRKLAQQHEAAADAFARGYPDFVAQRKAQLNGLFNAADYPPVDQIRSKFKVEARFYNVSDAADFRADALDADTIADIRAEIEASTSKAEQEAVTATYRKIGEVVGHMATKLKEFSAYERDTSEGKRKTYFKDSLVDNVRELADLLPAFNMTDDAKLTTLADRIKRELCVEEADDLRTKPDAREAVQKSAEEIFDAVSAFMA